MVQREVVRRDECVHRAGNAELAPVVVVKDDDAGRMHVREPSGNIGQYPLVSVQPVNKEHVELSLILGLKST